MLVRVDLRRTDWYIFLKPQYGKLMWTLPGRKDSDCPKEKGRKGKNLIFAL